MRINTLFAFAAISSAAFFSHYAQSATLDTVKDRGELKCGVDGGLPGFSAPDNDGRMRGIDADICRAVASAIGVKDVRYVPLTAKERFTALSSGEVDVLSRNTTHTSTRDNSLGLDFTYYNFIDGQGFLVRSDLGVKNVVELDGARICIQQGTTTELNLADFFRSNNISYEPVGYETSVQTREGFEKDACDALTSDKSQLAAIRSELSDPSSAVILPETISKEPLGPVVRQDDPQWRDIVLWTLYAMINAEELGVSSSNVNQMRSSDNPSVKRLLSEEGEACEQLSLGKGCFYNVIKNVGNYGEIYEANITPIDIPRAGSVNDLWTRGGLLYAPPIR